MKEDSEMHLTRAEEQVMQILWDLGEGMVNDVRDRFPDPKPVRNTISAIIRILERKGFAGHKVYGNVLIYYPVVSKQVYSKSQMINLMEKYFNNSFSSMASLFTKEKNLSIRELDEILEDLKKEQKKGKTK